MTLCDVANIIIIIVISCNPVSCMILFVELRGRTNPLTCSTQREITNGKNFSVAALLFKKLLINQKTHVTKGKRGEVLEKSKINNKCKNGQF